MNRTPGIFSPGLPDEMLPPAEPGQDKADPPMNAGLPCPIVDLRQATPNLAISRFPCSRSAESGRQYDNPS
ncbi:MAG: hypothetical protein QF706_00135, partial [Roseibacillus sp.]|nr:hypothetical protein [Roseibacillus sp.]